MKPERISAYDVRQAVTNDNAWLVCAYDSDDKFQEYYLDGAISLNSFKSKVVSMEKGQEIFFYCA